LKRGKRHIEDIKIETKINNKEIKQIKLNEADKILGFYMVLNMDWTKQYQIIKDKIRKAIAKLKKYKYSPITKVRIL